MKLIKLNSKKTEAQPKTLRTLSADECDKVSGGGKNDDYFTFYEGYDYLGKTIKGNTVFRTK